jgi:cobalamin biosynthesis protein CobW
MPAPAKLSCDGKYSMAAKIPVTVITGFLGSGKTTLIRHLLQNNRGRRIAVLVNEFGELGIDGELLRSCQVCPEPDLEGNSLSENSPNNSEVNPEVNIVELTNGCLCCTVQEEFLPTMLELLQRREQIDCILIETSGLALPKPLIKAFGWPEITHAATVDGVITVVDCAAVSAGQFAADPAAIAEQRLADPNLEHETPLQELFEDQLACADLVILNKSDLVDAQTQAEVAELVRQELPRQVKLVTSHQGVLDPELLLGFNAAVESDLAARPSHHDLAEDHDHDDAISATQFISPHSYHPQELRQHLEALVAETEIYRIKGFVAVPNKSMRLVLQGVGNRFEQFYDRPWQPEEARQTQLVLIGHDLDHGHLQARLAAIPAAVGG